MRSRSIHRKAKRLKLRIGNTVVNSSQQMKYLGMLFHEHLRFDPHLNLALSRARGALSKIYSILRKRVGLCTKSKLTLYKVLIRPILCYGASIWISCSTKAMKKCESFERKILRHCVGLSYNWKTKKCGRKTKCTGEQKLNLFESSLSTC